jgi:hypothetical protein
MKHGAPLSSSPASGPNSSGFLDPASPEFTRAGRVCIIPQLLVRKHKNLAGRRHRVLGKRDCQAPMRVATVRELLRRLSVALLNCPSLSSRLVLITALAAEHVVLSARIRRRTTALPYGQGDLSAQADVIADNKGHFDDAADVAPARRRFRQPPAGAARVAP